MNNDLIKQLSEAFPNLEWQEGVTCVTGNNLETVRVAVYLPFNGVYSCKVRLMRFGSEVCAQVVEDNDPVKAVSQTLDLTKNLLAAYAADLNKAKERK